MKKLLALLLAMAMVFGLVACGGSDSKNDDGGNSDAGEVKTMTVGTDVVGYVTIPEDWLTNQEGTEFQTASPDFNSYITLDIFDVDSMELPEGYETMEEWLEDNEYENMQEYLSTAIWYALEESDIYDIEGSVVDLCGFEANQVYGVYDSEYTDEICFIICWIFEDNGVYRYVAAEGPYSDIMDVKDYVEKTYTTP